MRFRSRTRGRPFRGTATFRGRGKLNIRTSRPELDDYKPSHRARTPSYESSHKIKPHSSLERDYRSRDYKESYSGSRRYDDPRSDRRRYSRSRSRSRSRSPDDSRYRNWRRSRSRNRSRSRHRSFSPHHRSPRRSPSRSPHSSRHTSSFRYQSSQRSPDHFRSGNERLEMQRTLPPGFKESEDPETSGLLEKSLGAGCGVNSPPPESLRITVGNDLFQERCGSKSIHDRLGTPPEATSTQYSGRREKYMDKIGFGEKLPSASVDRSEQEMQTSDKIDMFYNEKKIERNVLLQDTDHFPRAVGPCFNERFKSLLDEREKCKLKLGINVDLKQNSNDSFSTFMKELDSPPWVTSPTSSVDQFKQSSKNSKKKLQELTKDILDTKSLFCGIPGLSDDFPTKSYTGDVLIPGLGDVEGIDDEERFLYGDDADNVPTPKLSEKAHTIDKSIRKKIRKFTRSSSPSSSRSSSRSSSKSSNRSFRNSRSRNSTSRSYSRSPSRKRNRDGLCRDQSEKRGRRDSLRYDDNSYYNKNDADFQSSHGNSFPLFSNLMGNSLKIKDDLRKEKTLHRSTSESNREGNQKIEEVDFLRSFSEPIKGGSRKLEDILKSIGFNFDMLRKPADSTISEHSSSFTTDDVKTENIDKYSKRNDSNMPLCEDSRVPSNVASLIQAARHNSEDPWQQQSSGLVSSQDTLVSNVITSQPSTDYCSTNYSAPHQPPQFPPMAPANYPQFTPYQGHFTPNYSHPMYPGPFPHMPPFPPANDNYDPNVMSTANRSNLRVIPLQSDTQKKIPGPTKLITSNPMSTEKHPPTAKIPTSNLSNLKVVPSSQIENRKKSLNEKPSTVSRNISMEKRVLTAKEKQELALKHEGSLKRLELLEKELDRLKKQQGELMRKKQKQKDGHKDPLLMENNKLQEEISRQINSIRRALEGSGAPVNAIQDLTAVKEERTDSVDSCKSLETEKSIKQNKSIKDEIDAAEKELEYEYFDPGNHWCKQCNEMLPNIYSMFEHLHSKRHIQSLDPYDRPWMPECLKNPKQKSSERTMVAPLKGVQFLMPCSAFYCTICSEFMGDATCAEEHLKKVPHNRNYLRYVLENPFYERRWNLDKAAGMAVRSEEKRKQIVEEDEDRDLKHKKKANETQKKIKENKQKRFKELEGMDSVSDVKENQNDKDNATAFRNKSTEKEKSESPIHPMSEDDTYKSTGFGKFTWRKDEKEFIGPENLEINFETSKDSESDDPNNKVVTKPGSKIAIRLSGKTLIPPSVQFKSVNRKKVEIGKMPQLAFPLRKIKPEKNHSEKPLPLGKFISVEKPSAIGKTVPLPIAQEKSSSPTFLPTQEDIANAFGGKFDGNGSEGATQENLCKVETKLKKEKPESHKMSLDIMTIPLPPADITKNKEIVGENTKSSETSKIKKIKVNSKDSLEVSSDNITNENIQSLSERSNVEMQPNNSDRDVGKDQITEKDDLPNKSISPVIKEVDNTEQLVTENDIDSHKKLQEELSKEKNQPQVKKQIELSESEKAAIEDFKMLGIDINDTVVVDVKPPPLLSESLLSNRPINSAATASVCAKDLYEIYFNKNSNANSQLSTEAEIITECVTVIQEKLSGITEDCKKETEKIIQNSNLIMEDDKFKNTIIVSSDNIPGNQQYVSQSENMEVDNQKLENDSVVLLGISTDTKKSTTTTEKNENISCEASSLLKEFHSDVVPSPNEEMEIDDVTDIEKITLNINSEITTSLQVSEMKESPDVTAQPNLFSASCTKQYPSLSKEKSIDSEKIMNTIENVNLLTAQNTNICSTVDGKNLNSKSQISSENSIAADEILQSICFTPTALAKNEESSVNKQDCKININKTQIIETQHNLVTEDIIERNSASNNMINQTLNNNPEEKCLPLTDSVDSNFKNSNESKTDEKKVLHSNNESDDVKSPTQTSEREVVQIMADENLANKNVSIMNESDKPTILGIIEKDENVNKTKVTIENDKVESHPFSHVSVDSTKLEASDFHSSYSPSLNKNTDVCKNIVPHIESVSLGICKEAVDNISSETEIIVSDLVSSENSNNDVDQNKVKDLNLNSKSTVEAVQNSNTEIFQNESESSGILVKENNESCKNDHADLPSLSDICENQATSSEMLVETVLGQTSNETFESMKTDE